MSAVTTGDGLGNVLTINITIAITFTDHERDWPLRKAVFSGLATKTLNVINKNNKYNY